MYCVYSVQIDVKGELEQDLKWGKEYNLVVLWNYKWSQFQPKQESDKLFLKVLSIPFLPHTLARVKKNG